MSFFDAPKVDDKIINSEQSVLAVKSVFCMKNGFISRDEQPDYGVDLNVELINNKGASGNKFPIQIKSTIDLNIIENNHEKYVSLEFKTSRLGYLCNFAPSYGIIIIYDDTNNVCYFDYVEEIYFRINSQKANEDWKSQDNVNINIPISNVLKENIIKDIHTRFSNRFNNHDLLIKKEGLQFGIPYLLFSANSNHVLNINDHLSIINFLEKYGYILSDSDDYSIISNLLSRLTVSEINNSSKLQLLSLLYNYRSGFYIEADYFRKKIYNNINAFSNNEKQIIELTSIYLDFTLGIIDSNIYLDKLIEIENIITFNINKYRVQIEILYLKSILFVNDPNKMESVINDINNILTAIEDSSIEIKTKELLRISLAQSLFNIAHSIYINNIALILMRSSMKLPTSIDLRLKYFNDFYSLYKKSRDIIVKSYEYAVQNHEMIIAGISLLRLSNIFHEISVVSLNLNLPSNYDDEDKIYKINIDFALKAFHILNEVLLKYEAFQSLGIAYDLLIIYNIRNHRELDIKIKEEIANYLSAIEKELGIKYVDNITKQKEIIDKANQENEDEFYKNLGDDELKSFAGDTLEALMLPTECLEYIVDSLKNHRHFFQNKVCKHMSIMDNSSQVHYKERIVNIVFCEYFQFQSKESSDITIALKDIISNYCINCREKTLL